MADQRRGGIAWTDFSVNPIRARLNGAVGHHCVKVSPGCTNCYASTLQPRFKMPPFEVGKRIGVKPFLDEKQFRQVLTRRKPARWFWCDMTDLFGEWVPDEWIDACFAVMALTPHHTHQVLTKRPGRMLQYARSRATTIDFWDAAGRRMGHALRYGTLGLCAFPLPNVWLGVSAEDQARADERIPLLLQTPAAVRFVSAEPLLGPIDLLGIPTERLPDLIIAGGESGHDARRCDVGWIRDLRDDCLAHGVSLFVKQLGAYVTWSGVQGGYLDNPSNVWPNDDHRRDEYDARGFWRKFLKHRKGADPSEWPDDLRVRQLPAVPC